MSKTLTETIAARERSRLTPPAAPLPELKASRLALPRIILVGLCAVLMLTVLTAIGIGAVEISPLQSLAILAHHIGITSAIEYEPQQAAVLMAIRLPRVLLGALVGAGLAVAGATMQGLFRNPLADPGLIGVSSGAALAAVATIVTAHKLSDWISAEYVAYALPVAAFGGGLITTLLVGRIGRVAGLTSVATMLLAGIAVNAFAGAGIGLLTFSATDVQLRNITFWSLGSLGAASWTTLMLIAPFISLSLIVLPRMARALNALLLGEAEAGHLGVRVERLKRVSIVCAALAVGASVAVCGVIGFVGLIVPHLLRLSCGADNRLLLPASALLGAVLLVAADTLARIVVAPAELPIGIVTAIIGAPFFFWLLMRGKRDAASL